MCGGKRYETRGILVSIIEKPRPFEKKGGKVLSGVRPCRVVGGGGLPQGRHPGEEGISAGVVWWAVGVGRVSTTTRTRRGPWSRPTGHMNPRVGR